MKKNKLNQQEKELTYNILLSIRNNLKDIVNVYSKKDFLTFVRSVAPTLVDDWHMGKHIEVLSQNYRMYKKVRLKG
jgi:hypothetical protein